MTRSLSDLTFEYVNSILRYDSDTGILTWRRRPLEHFKTANAWKGWNTIYADKEAGGAQKDRRTYYLRLSIGGRYYFGHRLAYLLANGQWPDGQLDHIDGNGLNNKLANLRVVTNSQNLRNARMKSNNTSGVTGVYWARREGKWMAAIGTNGRLQHLGHFATIEEATAARLAAEKQHGFTARHGKE